MKFVKITFQYFLTENVIVFLNVIGGFVFVGELILCKSQRWFAAHNGHE